MRHIFPPSDVRLVRHRIAPEILCDDRAEAAWTSLFYNHPIAFHMFQWTGSIHRDLVDCRISASMTTEALTHRLLGIQMLRRMLAGPMGRTETELAVLAVMCLALNKLDDATLDEMYSAAPSAFQPPMLTNDFNIQSRPKRDPGHQQMLTHLIQRLGPWETLQLPGLAGTLAMSVSSPFPF